MANKVLTLELLWVAPACPDLQPLQNRYALEQWKANLKQSQYSDEPELTEFCSLFVYMDSQGVIRRELASKDEDVVERVQLLAELPTLDNLMAFSVAEYDDLFGKGPLIGLHETIGGGDASLYWRGSAVVENKIRAVFVSAEMWKHNGKWLISERTVYDGMFSPIISG